MNHDGSSTADHYWRPAPGHPGVVGWLGRIAAIAVVNMVAVVVMARLLPGFTVDGLRAALVAGLIIGLLNAFLWPAISSVVTPLSVLTLGLATVVLNAAVTQLVLTWLPGIDIEVPASVMASIGLALLSGLTASVLSLDDDVWYDEIMAKRSARRLKKQGAAAAPRQPGVVFIQIDGLSRPVLERSMASGNAPTLRRWLRRGSHRIVGWETEWSSQTGVSQAGILHGSVDNIPAFRWRDRRSGEMVVSNHPWSAARIEADHSDGDGLLAHDGSGYGNLFTGDATRSVMTMSTTGKLSEGKVGLGYGRYFSRPDQTIRTAGSVLVEIVRERRAAGEQDRWGIEPRVSRNLIYAGLRSFTTIISRDVSVAGILQDMAEGRSVIYVDFLGYDEVSHHSGPERPDTMAVLRDIDRQVARIERSMAHTAREYRLVVLSDHGQTQGAPFAERYGISLSDMVEEAVHLAATGDPASDAGRTESSAYWKAARKDRGAPGGDTDADSGPRLDKPIVLGSGSLGLIYLPGPGPRLTRDEIDTAYPGLIDRLAGHPGIGFVLVATGPAPDGDGGAPMPGVILGNSGQVDVITGEVTGDDPLEPFGPSALAKIQRAHRYRDTADLMVNSMFDPVLDEVAPFEHQVGSHGGLGGPQNEPFLLAPIDMALPDEAIDGPVALHHVLKNYVRKGPVVESGPVTQESTRELTQGSR